MTESEKETREHHEVFTPRVLSFRAIFENTHLVELNGAA